MEQDVRIDTLTLDGRSINGAQCVLVNEKGRSVMRSGKSSLVQRAGGDLSIQCELDGQAPALGQAISRANAGLAGNILIGGAIGAAVDVGTGAAYTYPAWMQLVFGQERRFDRAHNRSDSPSSGELVRTVTTADLAVRVPAPVGASMEAAARSQEGATISTVPQLLRRGDVLEYALNDRLTGNSSRVYYRVDRVSADEVVFNQGARIETPRGQLVSLSSPIGGLFDASSPPEGWMPRAAEPGTRWSERYVAQTGAKWLHELKAVVTGRATQVVEGQSLDVVHTRYEGWVYAPSGGLSSGSPTGTWFQADVAYAPALERVVKFEAIHRPAYGPPLHESLELVRVQR